MDVKLQIDRNVGACCDSESTRYALGNVRLHDQGGQVYATATNGKCLTVCPLEGEIDAPCLMPAGAVPTVKAGGTVIGNGKWRTRTGKRVIKEKVTPGALEGRFPKILQVLRVKGHACRIIDLDPRLLASMGEALTSEESWGLSLVIPEDADGPVRVIGAHGFGVIMPMGRSKDSPTVADYDRAVDAYGDPD